MNLKLHLITTKNVRYNTEPLCWNSSIAGVGNTVKRLWPTQRKRVSNFFKDDVDFSVHFHKKSVKKYHVFDWMCVRTLARNCKISSYIIYIAAALELQYTIIMNFKSSRIPYVNWISNAVEETTHMKRVWKVLPT